MHRKLAGLLCFLCCLTAHAQRQVQMAPQTPLEAAFQAHAKARGAGRFEEAAAKREEARGLLAQVPPEAPQFGGWVQMVAQMYQNGGMHARARDIAQEALARVSRLGDAYPTRIQLLGMLAGFWQEDRNLLKAATYQEKVVSALEAAPQADASAPGPAGALGDFSPGHRVAMAAISGSSPAIRSSFYRFGPISNLSSAYQCLADLYQQLGRPEAAVALITKMGALAGNDSASLASFYERQGQLDEAAAIYQKQMALAAGDPQKLIAPLQSLSSLYQSEQRYGDAAALLQRAVATLDAAGGAIESTQSGWMRQNLAGMLRQAGKIAEADEVYQQLLAQSQPDPNYSEVLIEYAAHLSNTKRGVQAESLLNDYAASHPQLQPWQETSLLFARSNAARVSGDAKRAEEYQQSAIEKNRATQGTPSDQVLIGSIMQKALSAANSGNLDEAFSLTLQGLATAPHAADGEQIVWQVSNVVSIMANKKASAKAEQLYQELFGVVQAWSPDNLQPLTGVAQNYARFLMGQRDRAADVPEAIERYRKILVTARGAGTGFLEDPLRLTIEFERHHGGSPKRALLASQDLLELEESMSGNTSQPYLNVLGTLADLYESGGDYERSLPLKRQAVAIGDLAFPAKDARRGEIRVNLALALARRREFDDAERLVNEAIEIGKSMRPPQDGQFTRQLENIRRMKSTKAAGPQ